MPARPQQLNGKTETCPQATVPADNLKPNPSVARRALKRNINDVPFCAGKPTPRDESTIRWEENNKRMRAAVRDAKKRKLAAASSAPPVPSHPSYKRSISAHPIGLGLETSSNGAGRNSESSGSQTRTLSKSDEGWFGQGEDRDVFWYGPTERESKSREDEAPRSKRLKIWFRNWMKGIFGIP
ncbi:hypothetical protein EJ08DRAFT_694729 [Tothia fuscella]|uniref:Uncharacterized protein n=1 Tax=Tothia fuscella TaxID=1048955 RepID=A0A9P4NX90_9PEZI|nr:hypothetical protein EJ08DRAFT_694729 [Tothia fuscella]